jgi:excisionase family DNA binding protein
MKKILIDNQLELIEQLFKKAQVQHKNILTLVEAAEFLGLSVSYMYKLTHWNKLPYYKPSGKLLYFKRQELEEWMLQNKSTTQAEIEILVKEELKKTQK